MLAYTTKFLTPEMGDVTLGWTDDQAAMMEEVIARKMAEGYTFFVMVEGGVQVRLKTIADLNGGRSVTIGDKEAEALIRDGKIGLVDPASLVIEESEPGTEPSRRRARTAREAATSQTVAVRPARGG